MDFYQVLIELSNKKGVAPSRAALDIGLSKTAVNGYKEKGSMPTDANIAKFAEYFGITADEIYEKMGIKKEPTSNRSELIESAINLFEQLQPEEFERVLAYAQGIIDNHA